MKRTYKHWALFVIVIMTASCQQAWSQAKKNIVILATGGTIAGAAATGTQAGYTSGQVKIDTEPRTVWQRIRHFLGRTLSWGL